MTSKELAKLILETIEDEEKYGDSYIILSIVSICENELEKKEIK